MADSRGTSPEDPEELELRTTGRRTGQPHAVRLWFAREGELLWLRADAGVDWLRNLRRHPECVVRIGDRELAATYEPLAGDREAALRHVVELWRTKYGPDWVQDWWYERGREPVRLRLAAT